MWRIAIVTGAALAVVLPASSGQIPDQQSPAASGRTFSAPPIVERASDTFRVTVRLDRPLPTTAGNLTADIGLPSATSAAPGLQPLGGTTDCYQEDLFAIDSSAEDATTVRLALGQGPAAPVADSAATSVEPATDWSDHHNRELAQRLGCHRTTKVKHCSGAASIQNFRLTLSHAGGGASCATGRRVLHRIEDRVPEHRCNPRLCLTEGGSYAGFRCHSVYAGERHWRLVCRRGRAEISGRATA